MTDTKQDKTTTTADVRALRPIGWFMGGVTVVCAVMAVATGYWTQQQARGDFNRQAASAASARQATAQISAKLTVPFLRPRGI